MASMHEMRGLSVIVKNMETRAADASAARFLW
jgi:hypothetical protein